MPPNETFKPLNEIFKSLKYLFASHKCLFASDKYFISSQIELSRSEKFLIYLSIPFTRVRSPSFFAGFRPKILHIML